MIRWISSDGNTEIDSDSDGSLTVRRIKEGDGEFKLSAQDRDELQRFLNFSNLPQVVKPPPPHERVM